MGTDLGARIRELRKAKGWSARELSELTGGKISRSQIADIETGRTTDLHLTSALGIARVFGITIEQLTDAKTPASALAVASEIAEARALLRASLRRDERQP